MGIASTVWFLVRVIPKPQRATYPCMKAAAPFMSGFVVYLLSMSGMFFAFKKFRERINSAKYISALAFVVVAIAMFTINELAQNKNAKATNLVSSSYFDANNPIGTPQGLHPGRVVWVWNPDATDANFTVKNNINNWWANYTNAQAVENMLNTAIKKYSGKDNINQAWDALFKHFNSNKNKGNTGYQSGEKIFIKINVTNSCCSVTGTKKTKDYDRMDSTPELMLALLKQLIEEVGVAQEDIFIGDPFRTFHNLYWDVCHTVYPNVNYVDGKGDNGRYRTKPTSSKKMFFSDGKYTYRMPQEYYDAAYFINMPCLKSHDSGGITIGAKNHQGSILQDGADPDEQSAYDMHYSLPDHDNTDGGTHRYRHLVDYLGHEKMGGNTLLTIVDGIWAGRSWEGYVEKWQMVPFNGDYPNSIFVSQDLVAIDAVCYDFLLEEYKNKEEDDKHPYMAGTDDYLLQAASPEHWAEGITYDPEDDGISLKSLGVYEHWNNPTDKAYSKNLGTGNGIELLKVIEFPSTITTQNTNLPNNKVNAIHFDPNGVAWIGTDNGLARYNGIDMQIINTENHLSNNKVNDLAFEQIANDQKMWVATDGGLTVLAINNNGVVSATTYSPDNSDIVGTAVSNVMIDWRHNCWASTESAINVLSENQWDHKTTAGDSNGESFDYSEFKINDLAEYKFDSTTFVATNGKGIIRLKYNSVDGFTGASTYGSSWAGLSSDTITAIAPLDVEQWYGSSYGVMRHENMQTKSEWLVYTAETDKIFANNINTIFADTEENIWIGTNIGLNIIKANGEILKYDQSQGLINNTINTITEDTNGNIWIGTNGGAQWFNQTPGISIPTNIEYIINNKKYKAYPNPANSVINIDINSPSEQQITISVYNMHGQLKGQPQKHQVFGQQTITIDISDQSAYQPGLYMIKIDDNTQTNIIKTLIK